MHWLVLLVAPSLAIEFVDEHAIELRARALPRSAEAVYFRPLDVPADPARALARPDGDRPYLGYGAHASLGPRCLGLAAPGGPFPDAVCDTAWVTSPDEFGPGTLRDRLETRPVHDAVIAFDPHAFSSGAVRLTRAIRVRSTHVLVDGRTAGRAVRIEQSNVEWESVFVFDGYLVPGSRFDTILRNLEIVQGGAGAAGVENTADGVHFANGAGHVVIDHCAFGPARDEAIGISNGAHDISVQWCTFNDVVKTLLVSNFWSNITIHHSFFHTDTERLVLATGQPFGRGGLELTNNVVYDWRNGGMQWGDASRGNLIGNTYLVGPTTRWPHGAGAALTFRDPTGAYVTASPLAERVYLQDNAFPAEESDDERTLRAEPWPHDSRADPVTNPNVRVVPVDADVAFADVLAEAGTSPHRSAQDSAAAHHAWLAARYPAFARWTPVTDPYGRIELGPNERLVADVRYTGPINVMSPFSAPIEAWTLARRPGEIRLLAGPDPDTIALRPERGGNPVRTELAIEAFRVDANGALVDGDARWVHPDGSLRHVAAWHAEAAWSEVIFEPAPEVLHVFRTRARNGAGVVTHPGPRLEVWRGSSARPEAPAIPDEASAASEPAGLEPGLPNPFRSSTSFGFWIDEPGRIRVDVFDVGGRRVRTLYERALPRGRHRVSWDGRDDAGRDVGIGAYLLRLSGPGLSDVKRAVRVR